MHLDQLLGHRLVWDLPTLAVLSIIIGTSSKSLVSAVSGREQ